MYKKIFFLSCLLFLGFVNEAFAASATLTWNANTEPDLAGYKIYYDTISHAAGTCPNDYANYASPISVGPVTSHTVSGLTEGQTYYFQIVAFDTSNNLSPCSVSPGEQSVTINRPTILSVNSDKANGTYGVGEVIDIDLTFSETVSSVGNITVNLETGTTDRSCAFVVSGANNGTCNYVVQPGDDTSDLTILGVTGTINDLGGNSMTNFLPAINLAANKNLVIDTTGPSISNIQPTGILAAGATLTTVSFVTNKLSTCKYSTSAGVAYASMTNAFSTTGGTNHSFVANGLTSGSSYIYYARCIDTFNNANNADSIISFSITATSGSGSGSSAGSAGSGQAAGGGGGSPTTSSQTASSTQYLATTTVQAPGPSGMDASSTNKVIANSTNAGLADEAQAISTNQQFVNLNEIGKSLYVKIVALDPSSFSMQNKKALALFIHEGTPSTRILGAGERAGVVSSYYSAFNALPKTLDDWRDVIKIGNGRWTSKSSKTAETQAEKTFQKIYKRQPKRSQNKYDENAVRMLAYGLRPSKRNSSSEKAAIKSFKAIYKKAPTSANDWNTVRAIAYSGAKR